MVLDAIGVGLACGASAAVGAVGSWLYSRWVLSRAFVKTSAGLLHPEVYEETQKLAVKLEKAFAEAKDEEVDHGQYI